LLTDYVPRGCILTTEAVDRLFEERRPDLVSRAPERAAEIQQLQVLKRAAATPLAIKPLNSPAPVATERKRPGLAESDRQRLGELAAIEAEVLSAHEAAASEIRTALAEGDFPAMMLATHGHEAPIPPETWRATGGLECIKAGRVRIQFPHSIEVIEGRAFVKEIDLITWLSTHAPKPFSEIGINFIVQSPPSTKSSVVVGNKPKVADVASGMLPPWLTPMEAVAWIVSRDTKVVACASPAKNSVRTFVCDYVRPNGKRVSGTETLPPGMTLRWLDRFAAYDPDSALPTDAAMSQLLGALQSGQLVARAEWTATGERRDMDADEWAGMVFDTLPGQERILLPHRTFPGQIARLPEKRWNAVLLPHDALVSLWPAPGQQSVQSDVRPFSGDPSRVEIQYGERFRSALSRTTSQVRSSAAPPRQNTAARPSLPVTRRGPKGGLTEAAAQRMANDVREGWQTLSVLRDMKQESLAAAYGVGSRDTALKALRRAAAIVGNSPTDK
jgi:hypothetical protein